MNPDPSKLRHQQTQQQAAEHLQTQQTQAVHEFESVEKLIRHDAKQTPVPSAIAERLGESIAREPKPTRPWWKRLFSGGS